MVDEIAKQNVSSRGTHICTRTSIQKLDVGETAKQKLTKVLRDAHVRTWHVIIDIVSLYCDIVLNIDTDENDTSIVVKLSIFGIGIAHH